jgi:hypothetical protein
MARLSEAVLFLDVLLMLVLLLCDREDAGHD